MFVKLLKNLPLMALLVLPLGLSAEEVATESFTGRIISVDRNAGTIIVETPVGLKEYEVDSNDLIIEEVGPLEGYVNDPTMKELRLGDLVRVTEEVPSAVAERTRMRKVQRQRMTVVAEAPPMPDEPAPRPMPTSLPKTASALPLIALLGGLSMLGAGAVRLYRRARSAF